MKTELFEKCIEIKEAVKSLESHIQSYEDVKDIIGNNYPKLTKKFDHQIEIKQMAIARINLIFSRTLNKLNQEQ